MKFEPIFKEVMDENVKRGDTLIIGVSGGPDSVALLNLFVEYLRNANGDRNVSSAACKIIVAHVNHGIRGKAATHDENFVKDLAVANGLKFEVARAVLRGKSAIEERGRNLRREFFNKLREKYKARWIVTAHTQDDNLETIIFNFLRGSGPAGLAGMRIADKPYLKPLLGIAKSELLAYLRARKQKYCRDATNMDTRFRRNFIRKKVVPLLTEINPALHETLIRNGALFSELNSWATGEAQEFLSTNNIGRSSNREGNSRSAGNHRAGSTGSRRIFSLRSFEQLPQALKRVVIQEVYRSYKKTSYRLPIIKVDEILRLLTRNIGNKKIECPGGGTFLLKDGFMEFRD